MDVFAWVLPLLQLRFFHELSANVTGDQGTRRPLHVSFINNPECASPRITLKRDPSFGYAEDVTIPLQVGILFESYHAYPV